MKTGKYLCAQNLCVLGLVLGMVIPAGASELTFFAVDDQGPRNSQLVYVEQAGTSLNITEIGSTHVNHDIEGIDFHPTTGIMYAVGGEINRPGWQKLYTWDTNDGSLSELGFVGGPSNPFDGRDLIASGFRNDGSYWISIEDQGLYTIDLGNLSVTLESSNAIFTTAQGAEGIAWSVDGSELYLARGESLLSWNPLSDTVTEIMPAGDVFGHEIEGLGLSLDGTLIATGGDLVYEVGFNAGEYELLASYSAGGRDFETLAIPEPTMLALLAMTFSLIRRRR